MKLVKKITTKKEIQIFAMMLISKLLTLKLSLKQTWMLFAMYIIFQINFKAKKYKKFQNIALEYVQNYFERQSKVQ